MGKHGKRPDTECNMKCRHDSSRMCGAGWRNNIFKLVVTKKTYVSIIGETQGGCYKDSGRRDLPTMIREAGGIPRNCFQMAKDKGFKYAGL
jgi:hypothetical protein